MNNKLIKIFQPRVTATGEVARLVADVLYLGQRIPVWYEVAAEYGRYLCYERSDAFLIGLLNFAMRNGCDIECEAPVTTQLLFQIRTYLIPSLTKYSLRLYPTQIIAEADDSALPNAGGVGAGISCGIDSLHVVRNFQKSEYKGYTLTHLVLNNVGAFSGTLRRLEQFNWQMQHAREFCAEAGFKLIETNSNFDRAFLQNHFLTHTYSSCFAVYALQKLWAVYFYGSSGHDFQESFSLRDNDLNDAADYELLSLDVFSTRALKIYSEGGEKDRFEKTKEILDYPLAGKYLHVCTCNTGPNCNRCPKCCRTLVTLDALGALEKFEPSFDIAYYRAHRQDYYLRWLYLQILRPGDVMVRPAYEILHKEIALCTKMSVWWEVYGFAKSVNKIKWKVHSRVQRCKAALIKFSPAGYHLYKKVFR